eukprot:Gregarina_sp_Poly_1__6002@NODE_315_length_9587_cov_683_543592_g270_i0_p2_GENE_NODE_315_length_9587_cov_683_543592_g270_i0NODE_315_length_9587_cov_683_543592_g270_i0_p2_ORF_typecomplete_len435_score78_88PCI/PF01399_27/8_8e02PCI/PF01399_27/0_00014eIF3m_C_helix/PF18005_1/0_0097Prefoldin_2/PF01920_20/0_31Prefoldin_2/PF01920_20/3e03_NODE_315_length_9587_cov_683_543592_g270_i034514755
MVIAAIPIENSYGATIQAADRLFKWLRPTEPEQCDSLFAETYQALNKKNVDALFKVLAKLTEISFRLLQHAKEEGQIKGQAAAEGDEQAREITKSYNEFTAEVDEILMCFVILCREVGRDSQQLESFVSQIAEGQGSADTRLKTLLYVFNSEEKVTPLKASLFKIIVKYAAESNYFDVAVMPVLGEAIRWVEEWPVSAADKREIYLLVASLLKKSGKLVQSLTWAKQGIKTYDNESTIADTQAAIDQAAGVLLQAIKLPSEFYFDKLLGMKSVKLLENHDDYKCLYEVGEIFLKGTVNDLEVAFKSNLDLVSKHLIDFDACMRKMRVIAVASEASKTTQGNAEASSLSDRQILNINDLAKVVGLLPEETEEACVSAVGAGLFDAKMDQLNQTISIDSAMKREFTMDDWQFLRIRLQAWKDKVTQMKLLLDAKAA